MESDLFQRYKQQIAEIGEHYPGCQYEGGTTPIDVTPCNCFVRQVFNLGREAERSLQERDK